MIEGDFSNKCLSDTQLCIDSILECKVIYN